ncbi:histidine--tRNA ligase [Candidatus Woesearchaeota archaeon]|nr:histidine--tRNA ligase [Candidatus Woesearchaeota archaeon]
MTELTPKGVRDFLPEEKILRNKIVDTLKYAFELYGYNPLETPALERYEILASKYGGGEEILKETFSLTDQGKRKLGLRYDLTVPFARLIAMNPNLKMPFKRYQIDRVWRDGPIKLGRYREFWQADCDVVGTKSMLAEAELLSMADLIFKKFGLYVEIQVNNRKLLNEIMNFCGVKDKDFDSIILSLDKLEKIGEAGVKKELLEKNIEEVMAEKIIKTISLKGDNEKILYYFENLLGRTEGVSELRELVKFCDTLKANVKIVPTLARGLSYYTGTVFEIFLTQIPITSSIAAGGRFDKMIGLFLGKEEECPAVGISFGIDVISEALKLAKKTPGKKSVVDAYVVPIGDVLEKAISVVQELRKSGINADIDLMNRGVTKNLSFANSYGIRYVIFLGQNEIDSKKLKLRDMEKGEERLLKFEEIIKVLCS